MSDVRALVWSPLPMAGEGAGLPPHFVPEVPR